MPGIITKSNGCKLRIMFDFLLCYNNEGNKIVYEWELRGQGGTGRDYHEKDRK
jgi:hypothetical protein